MVNGDAVYRGGLQSLAGVMKGPRPAPVVSLYGGSHWGGVGSENYATPEWDNTVSDDVDSCVLCYC